MRRTEKEHHINGSHLSNTGEFVKVSADDLHKLLWHHVSGQLEFFRLVVN